MSTGPTTAETAALLLESPRLLSVDEYHRMMETGILDEDEGVELLEGVIVAMSPQSPPHARCIQWLTRFLSRTLGDEYAVRVQLPLTLGARNEPEPDVAVVRADDTSRDRHPGAAVLVIEVAGDSLRRDRHIKAALYARGGIPEYWIVNVEAQVIEAFADPDAAAGAYRRTRTVAASEIIASEALPPDSFSVSDLFA